MNLSTLKISWALFPFSFKHISILVIVILPFISVSGCENDQSTKIQKEMPNINILQSITVSEETIQAIQTLEKGKIFFSHHSVGQNILSGIERLSKEVNSSLVIQNIDIHPVHKKNMIAHSTGGKNTFPKTKIDSFVDSVNSLENNYRPQVAFLKLCYIDFNPESDVTEIFEYYHKEMKKLQNKNPDIKLVHLTVPLTTQSNGIKSKMQRFIGKRTWEEASNIKRKEYNEMISGNYPENRIFDVAKIESTHQDGSRESFIDNGKTYYRLSPEYASDNGHLNDIGQRITAIKMVNFLADKLNTN